MKQIITLLFLLFAVSTISAASADSLGVSDNYPVLRQNYPNPFNPTTEIKYHVFQNGLIKLTIFNLVAQEVAILVNRYHEAREDDYSVLFDASPLNAGVYIYQLETSGYITTKRMILLK